jgi:nucleoside phosphorylase
MIVVRGEDNGSFSWSQTVRVSPGILYTIAVVDILIATALPLECDQAVKAGLELGINKWEKAEPGSPFPYLLGTLAANGQSLTVALWDSTRMGSISVGPVVGALVEHLKPRCLAMFGVCAGNPSDLALGDVVIAEMVYQYDEGKRDPAGFTGDLRPRDIPADWLRAAQRFRPQGLPSFGPSSELEGRIWILERLYAKEDPSTHPARARYFDGDAWPATISALQAEKKIRIKGASLVLTSAGRKEIEHTRLFRAQIPDKLPFQVKVGPIASGNVVVKDGTTWADLKKGGVRTVLGLEMEGAVIGNTAYNLGVSHWLVVKGVMDHADFRKDDRYKSFAARASAEVMFRFLAEQLGQLATVGQPRPTIVKSVYLIGGVSGETDYPDFEASELGSVCAGLGSAIANSGAELIVCARFLTPLIIMQYAAMWMLQSLDKSSFILPEATKWLECAYNCKICWAVTQPSFATILIQALRTHLIRSRSVNHGCYANYELWRWRTQ